MNSSSSQNYSYALDVSGKIVHVSNALRGHQYYCPHCNALMTPHMGEIRRWHFTHKANLDNCNYETYLHKIAKIKYKKRSILHPIFSFLTMFQFIAMLQFAPLIKKKYALTLQ